MSVCRDMPIAKQRCCCLDEIALPSNIVYTLHIMESNQGSKIRASPIAIYRSQIQALERDILTSCAVHLLSHFA